MIDLKKIGRKNKPVPEPLFQNPFIFAFQTVLLGIWGEPKKIWLPDSRAPECYDFIFHFLLASKPPNSKGLEWYHWDRSTMP